MINVHSLYLPEFIANNFEVKIEFPGRSVMTKSGRIITDTARSGEVMRLFAKKIYLTEQEFAQFNNFFRARKGNNNAFLFRNSLDCVARSEILGEGAVPPNVAYYFFKTYRDQQSSYRRRINRIVPGSLRLSIISNQQRLDCKEESDISSLLGDLGRSPEQLEADIDYMMGVLKMAAELPQDHLLYADFEFDHIVRFSHDSITYQKGNSGAVEVENLELEECVF